MTRSVRRRVDLNETDILHLFFMLVKDFDGKKMLHGSIKKYADQFSISGRTVSRIWKLGSKFIENGDVVDVTNKLSKNVGRKRLEINTEKVKQIPLRRRKTIASLAHALEISKSVVHRRIKEGVIRRHSNAIKPQLMGENKKARLRFCLSMIQEHFRVARRRFNELGYVIFDGKIGIFPFTYQEPAKRKSKNRAAGTLETKPIVVVTQEISRSWLIEKVLPAIRDKWPMDSRRSTIYIQQYNARPHIKSFDKVFLEAARLNGFDIKLTCQPSNSPELNVLDLGYFRAIQAMQHQEAPKTIDELVAVVEKSYNNMTPKALNRVFLTLQECMIEIMNLGGGNNYKIPHTRKEKLEREGLLPLSLKCNNEVLHQAINHLRS